MSLDFEKFNKAFEPETHTFTDKRTNGEVVFKFKHKGVDDKYIKYSETLNELAEMSFCCNSAYPILVWWSEVEKDLRDDIHSNYISKSKLGMMDKILLVTVLEQKVCTILSNFDTDDVAEWRKMCEQDMYHEIACSLNAMRETVDEIADAICVILDKTDDPRK